MLRRQLALVLVLLGCGSSTPPDGVADAESSGEAETSDESTGAQTGETTASSATSVDPPEGSTTTTSGAEPTSEAETDASSSSGSAPDYPTPHFPMALGLQWTYRFTRVDGEVGTACDNQGDEHVTTVSDFDAATGVYTFTEEPWCYFAALEYRIDGDYIDVNSGAWYHQLLLPPELDATWAAGGASGATYVWDEHHETYTVEAGTFDDCWRRKQEGYDVWQIYCAGVGMVVSHYAAWGGDSRAELVDFSG